MAATLVAAAVAIDGPWGLGVGIAVIMSIFGLALTHTAQELRIHRRHHQRRYRRANPGCIDHRGRVRCHRCGHHEAPISRLMNRTFTRAHLRGQCRTTPFHRPEA